jgi:hypothetical protein
LKGVKKVDMDFDKGLFTLEVDGKTALKPSDLKSAVKKRFTVESILLSGLHVEARKDGDKILVKAKGSGLELEAAKGKDDKPYNDLAAKLGEGKTEFKLGGPVSEEKQKKDDKDVTVLKISVTDCSVVEPPK